MATRTMEQRLKFDHGLTVGKPHLVRFTMNGQSRLALVEIGKRGAVRWMVKPDAGDMYSSWHRLRGDVSKIDGAVIVWAARNPEMMAPFYGEPVAEVQVTPA